MKTYLYPLMASLLSLAACTNDTLQDIVPLDPEEGNHAATAPADGTFFVDYSVDGGASTRTGTRLQIRSLDYYVYKQQAETSTYTLEKHRRIGIDAGQQWPLTRDNMTWEQRQFLQDTLQCGIDYRVLFLANVDSTLFNYGTYSDDNPHPAVVKDDEQYSTARILLPNVPFHEDNYYCLWEDELTNAEETTVKRDDVLLQRIVTRTDIRRTETPTTLYDAIANSLYAEDGQWYKNIQTEVDDQISDFTTQIEGCVGYDLHVKDYMKAFQKEDDAVKALTTLLSNNKETICRYIKDVLVQEYVNILNDRYTSLTTDWTGITDAEIHYDTDQRANAIGFDRKGYHETDAFNTASCSVNEDYSIRFFGFEGTDLNKFSSITLSDGTTISGETFNTSQKINTHCDVVCDPVKSVRLTNSSTTNKEDLYDLTKAMENVEGWEAFKNTKPQDSGESDIITVMNYFFDCSMGHRGKFSNSEYELQNFPFFVTRPDITAEDVELLWELTIQQ